MNEDEPIMKCPACKGEGILAGPRICNRCRGEGVRACESETRVIKECGCGAAFNRNAWLLLTYVGRQSDGEGGRLELRNCDCCNSTIAIRAQKAAA